MFTNKIGGNTKRDHLWQLWCEPVTNHEVSVLPAGAKTENCWCGRELGNDKNTDNTNKELLILNSSLSCNPLTSQLAMSKPMPLSYADVIRKCTNSDSKHNSSTKCISYSETKNEKIKISFQKYHQKMSNYFARQSQILILSLCATRKKRRIVFVAQILILSLYAIRKKQRKVCVDSCTIKTQTYTHLSHESTHKTLIHELSIRINQSGLIQITQLLIEITQSYTPWS